MDTDLSSLSVRYLSTHWSSGGTCLYLPPLNLTYLYPASSSSVSDNLFVVEESLLRQNNLCTKSQSSEQQARRRRRRLLRCNRRRLGIGVWAFIVVDRGLATRTFYSCSDEYIKWQLWGHTVQLVQVWKWPRTERTRAKIHKIQKWRKLFRSSDSCCCSWCLGECIAVLCRVLI